MSTRELVRTGRDAYERRDWAMAFDVLSKADEQSPLDPEDLERLAFAAYLVGEDHRSTEVMARAHHEAERDSDVPLAARSAFWVGFHLFQRGETAQASGWLGRGQAVIEESGVACAAQGYFLMLAALRRMSEQDDPATAFDLFTQVHEHGRQFSDPDLLAFGRLGQGQASIRMGRVQRGVAYLDEVMVAVSAEEVSAVVAGIVYCAVIDACNGMFDVARAREWTAALTRWCTAQPDLVPYRGQCLVHRAQILELNGEWSEAMEEADRAESMLARPPGSPALGSALYEKAELHRLRGELTQAEECYRAAGERGHDVQPGLALLRLAQGRLEAARAGVRRALATTTSLPGRPRLLAASVEVSLATDDVDSARRAAEDLAQVAREVGAPYLEALAAQALAEVRLAEGDATGASVAGRRAAAIWRRLDAPFEVARSRVLVGLACRRLEDVDTAELELAAARSVFERLQAVTELRRLRTAEQAPSERTAPAEGSRRLSPRELEVLRLIATGSSNRTIAAELVISEKTVARHTANIFAKLDLGSRSAATAYAYRNGLV